MEDHKEDIEKEKELDQDVTLKLRDLKRIYLDLIRIARGFNTLYVAVDCLGAVAQVHQKTPSRFRKRILLSEGQHVDDCIQSIHDIIKPYSKVDWGQSNMEW